jgi:FolB domain-containing protein
MIPAMKSKKKSSFTVVGVEGLVIRCLIGMEPHELRVEQEIVVTIRAEVNIDSAYENDEIGETIDYRSLVTACQNMAWSRNYSLIEKYASDVVDAVLEVDKVLAVTVMVKKTKALGGLACPFIELTRRREDS